MHGRVDGDLLALPLRVHCGGAGTAIRCCHPGWWGGRVDGGDLRAERRGGERRTAGVREQRRERREHAEADGELHARRPEQRGGGGRRDERAEGGARAEAARRAALQHERQVAEGRRAAEGEEAAERDERHRAELEISRSVDGTPATEPDINCAQVLAAQVLASAASPLPAGCVHPIAPLRRGALSRRTQASSATATSTTAPAASTPPEGAGPEEWTLEAWVASDAAAVVAAALGAGRAAGQTGLAYGRALGGAGSGRAKLLELLQKGDVLEALAARVWASIERLVKASAATGGELQSKFLQEGAGTLSYSGLSTFFRGLEGKIGAPNPNVGEAMASEHAERDDSHERFTTSNYDVTTTSALEWAFVATPEQVPEGGWPDEKKQLPSEAAPRQQMPLDELKAMMAEKNAELAELSEPPLICEEAMAPRLADYFEAQVRIRVRVRV